MVAASAQARSGRWEQVWWCDVRACGEALDLQRVVGVVLGLPGAQKIAQALDARGRVLLVLDGADGLEEDALELLAKWRQQCPQLGVLMTVRQGFEGLGQQVELGPLPVEDAEALFMSRAAPMLTTLEQERRCLEALENVLAWVGGHPLALEIAASAVQSHLLANRALELPSPDVQDQQMLAMEAAVRWSLRWLEPAQRRLLEVCAAFDGPFDHDKLAFVAQSHPDEVASALGGLCRMGLVQRNAGQMPYLLPAVSGVVRQQLPLDRLKDLWTRHGRFLLEREGGVDCVLRAAHSFSPLMERWQDEQGEIYQLYQHLRPLNPDLAVRLGLILFKALFYQAPVDMNERMVRELSALATDLNDPKLHFHACLARANFQYLKGNVSELQEISQDTRRFAHTIDEPLYTLHMYVEQGILARQQGRADDAHELYQALIRGAQEHDEPFLLALGLYQATFRSIFEDDVSEAMEYLERLEAVTQEHGIHSYATLGLMAKGEMLTALSRYEEAFRCHQRVLDVCEPRRYIRLYTLVTYMQGFNLLGQGVWHRSQQHFETCLALERDIGGGYTQAPANLMLALQAACEGRMAQCAAYHDAAMGVVHNAGALDQNAWWMRAMTELFCVLRGMDAQAQIERDVRQKWLGRSKLAPDSQWALSFMELITQAVAFQGSPPADLCQRYAEHLGRMPASDKIMGGVRPLVDTLRRWQDPNLLPDQKVELRVRRDAGRFVLADGEVVSIERRAAMKRIFKALLTQHTDSSGGSGLSLEALFEAGWPGEKALPESREARVYNTISRLRKLGLTDVVVHNGDGYTCRADLSFEWCDALG